MLHLLTSGIGFVALAAAMIVVARRFASQRRPLGAVLSSAAAVALLGGFAVISSAPGTVGVLAFTAAIVLAWTWVSVFAVDTYRRTACLRGRDDALLHHPASHRPAQHSPAAGTLIEAIMALGAEATASGALLDTAGLMPSAAGGPGSSWPTGA